MPSAAQAEQPVSAQNAAGSLQRYLATHEHHFHTVFEGQEFPDYGLTLDGVIAMDAAGVGDAESARATTFVADNIGSYVGTGTESYAGATAKALLVSLSQGRTPKGFLGGVNLLARLKARQTTSGQFKDKSQFGDFSNTITQSLAVASLRKAGQSLGTKAVPFLANEPVPQRWLPARPLRQPVLQQRQCRPGRRPRSPSRASSRAARPAPVKTRISRAIHFLRTQQGSDGGVKGAGPTNTANSNSTGLAVLAFVDDGPPRRGHARAGCSCAPCATTAPSPRRCAARSRTTRPGSPRPTAQGAAATLSDQDLRATTQATLGFAPVPLYKVTNVGAKASAPAFTCP